MILLVDSSNLAYISYYSLPDLSIGELKTHIIFGFFNQVLNLSKQFESNKFIFCFDSSKSFRKREYPNYKNRHSEKTKEEIEKLREVKKQLKLLNSEILPYLGFDSFQQTGYEADDLIAKFCVDYPEDEKTIISSDDDLLQLINYRTWRYSPQTKKQTKMNDLLHKYGFDPTFLVNLKSYTGCKSDTIDGLFGIGEETAAKFIRGELKSGKKYELITSEEGKEIYKKNWPLIKLPYRNAPVKLKPVKYTGGKLKKERFINFFEEYEFYSFLKKGKFKQWEEMMNL